MSSSPKAGACQQDEAENQVAGGDIDGFHRKVNGCAGSELRHIALYELVMAVPYSFAAAGASVKDLLNGHTRPSDGGEAA